MDPSNLLDVSWKGNEPKIKIIINDDKLHGDIGLGFILSSTDRSLQHRIEFAKGTVNLSVEIEGAISTFKPERLKKLNITINQLVL